MRRLAAVCLLSITAVAASAQGPSADWRTISTDHFRVHYPVEYEAWTTRAASRLESIRDAVVREIGYAPDTPIDVIVANPVADPNGIAWTFLDRPRIIFYTEPPGPDEEIGAYSSWSELLAVHEVAHVVHMLRPSRNRTQRFIEQFLFPLNRITLAAPRWVLEGYATVIEGRLTGSGRPSGTARAMILRQWAAHGQLPSYSQLDSDSRFLGMSMAYLAGSAFLEWLEVRQGAGSLRNVWTRMTADRRRSFDEAFAGVFGESPERLYGEFTAELTASAITVLRAAPLREGELWQETARRSGEPAVSPDGERIVVVERPRDRPARLVVWSTGPPEDEEKRLEETLAEIRERDPEDIPPVRTKPLRRDSLHTFVAANGGDLMTPRWTADGQSILYGHRQPDGEGFLHHDLFRWTPETGENRRITHLADVKEADPLADGKGAVAVRSRFGLSQLVFVDLTTGDTRPITEPSLDEVHSHPRVDASGRRLAYVAHRAGTWNLIVRDLESGRETVIASDPGDTFAWPEWRPGSDELVATLQTRGFMELVRVRSDGTRVPVTRSGGGSTEAAPSPDGRIFFMSLEPDGFVVRVIDDGEAAPPPAFAGTLVPAVPPPPPDVASFTTQNLPSSRPYGLGRQEVSFLIGQNLAPAQNATEVGVRIGDVIGRLDTIAIASLGADDAQRGVAVATAWRGWPIDVSAHLFHAEDQREDRDGAELRGTWSHRLPLHSVGVEGGGLIGSRALMFLDGQIEGSRVIRGWRFEHAFSLGVDQGDFEQTRWAVEGGARRDGRGLAVRYEKRDMRAGEISVGGLPSTIIPRSAFSDRVFEPALPVASLTGDEYEGRFVEVSAPFLPLTLFYRQHRASGIDVEVAGGELTFMTSPLPIVGLPALRATIGVGKTLSGPLEHDTNWWLGMRWQP